MKTKMKKRISSFALTGVLALGIVVPVFAASVNVDGGVWDYGTSIVGFNQKKVYSNYLHNTKIHKASCSIGAHKNDSGWTQAGMTAFSSAIGGWGDTTHAYYNVID
ncbi:MAG: Lactococcin 972 family bacteriocin [Oscillospiraceae bacterium]